MNTTHISLLLIAALPLWLVACGGDDDGSSETASNTASNGGTTGGTTGDTTASNGAALSVTSVAPAMGSILGGDLVIVSGEGFVEGATVDFGDAAALNPVVLSAFQIRVETPSAGLPGPVAVTVSNPDGGSATLADGFTYQEGLVAQASWCAIQFPGEMSAEPGVETDAVFGRVYVDGCTNGDAQCSIVTGELGYGAPDVDPAIDPTSFTWSAAAYNPAHTTDDNDEYTATLNVAGEGVYRYAYRFTADGANWTYCDLDSSDNGFQPDQMGTLTVAETVLSVGGCAVQFPASASAEPGADTEPIFGRVYVDGCTNGDAQCSDVVGELGYGADGADPSSGDYTWVTAAYNSVHAADDNDEYTATLNVATEGTYDFAYRFSVDAGATWTYCDLDSSDNGFQPEQTGELIIGEEVQTIGWCQIQFPGSTRALPDTDSEPIFGRVYVDGCSNGDVQCATVTAELGLGAPGADPTADPTSFTWSAAAYNPAHTTDDNDEYTTTLNAPVGEYSYTYRFSIDAGATWSYCDTDGSDGFQPAQLGAFSVSEASDDLAIEWCTIQFPTEPITIDAGGTTDPIYGRVYSPGCTDGAAQCPGLLAELGYGPADGDPSDEPETFTWADATYNAGHVADNNDEYQSTLTVTDPGEYGFVYRFSGNDGETWSYCDVSGAEFSADEMGTLTAVAE